MRPAIQAIPTFGTCLGVTAAGRGINPPVGKYSSQSGGKDDRDRWNRPDHQVLGY
jgi:hypothetical protein